MQTLWLTYPTELHLIVCVAKRRAFLTVNLFQCACDRNIYQHIIIYQR